VVYYKLPLAEEGHHANPAAAKQLIETADLLDQPSHAVGECADCPH